MIATKVDDVYDVELPPTIKGTLAQFEYGVSLGFNGATSVLECLGVAGYQNVLLAYMLVPIVCAMLVLLSAAIMTRPWCTTRGILQTSAPLLLKLLFLAFPLVGSANTPTPPSLHCCSCAHLAKIGMHWPFEIHNVPHPPICR